jgi:serine/threonine-protein kinase PRP4
MAPSSSSDEGEIRDSGFEKATKSLPQLDGTSVDRQDRNRARNTKSPSPAVENGYRSKNRRSSDRSRSPFDDYAPRGSKRFRDDDHYDRGQGDPRRFKVHYEDRPSEQQRRTQRSYEDLDKGSSTEGDRLRYDDRDHYSDKRARTRSRSPYRAPRSDAVRGHPTRSHREGNRGGRYNDDRLRRNGYDDHSSRSARDQSVSNRGNGPVHADLSKREAKTMQGHSQQYNETSGNEPKVERYGTSAS